MQLIVDAVQGSAANPWATKVSMNLAKKLEKEEIVFLEEPCRVENLKGYKDIKALCFSPFEHHTAAGEETRKGSPYFLINIAGKEELNKAHTRLLETKYFDKFSEEEIKTLKVHPKDSKK